MARTDLWTREQMILVLNLYMKLPFGKMDARNPDVKHLASIIGRTAGAGNMTGDCPLSCLVKALPKLKFD